LSSQAIAIGLDACQAALKQFGDIKKVGAVTPCMPVGEPQMIRFLES
jgi:maleate isomerase